MLGSLSVGSIDTGLVLKVLRPIWREKPETASRVRGRVETILDWAKASGFRDGENPARWRGHLENVLPAKSKVSDVKHHKAMPYDGVSAFMAAARESRDQREGARFIPTDLAAARSKLVLAHSQIATARSEGEASGKTEGVKEGTTAERARIRAILSSDEAKGKCEQASKSDPSTTR
jgi:hypothetical protein